MKHLYLTILLLHCFFASALSQSYQPFLSGKLHFLSDSPVLARNFSLRTDSAGVVGNDSAFWMTALALPPSPSCAANAFTQFVPDQEGYFLDHFIRKSDGSYRFVSRGGDTVTLHTQLPTGQSWNFTTLGGVTATIAFRGLTGLSSVTDSLIRIDLSDGKHIELSQRFGILNGPDFRSYIYGNAVMDFAIVDTPMVPDFKAFFDWQVGDLYSTHDHYNSGQGIDFYRRYLVIDRIESAAGDSLTLTLRRTEVQFWWPYDTIYATPDTVTNVYTRTDHGFLEKATYEYFPNGPRYNIPQPFVYDAYYHGRKTIPCINSSQGGLVDSCGYTLYGAIAGNCLQANHQRYSLGIGLSNADYSIGQTMTTCLYADFRLSCYLKINGDSLGPCPQPFRLLHAVDPFATVAMHVQRHSQTGDLSLQWQGLPAGDYTWQWYDLQGRRLRDESVPMMTDGRRELRFTGAAGMYLLRISDDAGGWARTLRVPMAEK